MYNDHESNPTRVDCILNAIVITAFFVFSCYGAIAPVLTTLAA